MQKNFVKYFVPIDLLIILGLVHIIVSAARWWTEFYVCGVHDKSNSYVFSRGRPCNCLLYSIIIIQRFIYYFRNHLCTSIMHTLMHTLSLSKFCKSMHYVYVQIMTYYLFSFFPSF